MFTIPNIISLTRLPLAFLFLIENTSIRAVSILLAMLSDGLDGFIARRYNVTSRVGTLLDPLMDRFFVLFMMGIFIHQGQLTYWEATALISRDISVMLFGFYLVFSGKLSTFRFRAIWCGKITTLLQFLFFLGLTFKLPIPSYTYGIFIFVGSLALVELYLSKSNPEQAETR